MNGLILEPRVTSKEYGVLCLLTSDREKLGYFSNKKGETQ